MSVENYTVTWDTPANANVIVRANAEYLQDGEKMGGDVSLKTNAMVLKGTTLTITVEPETYYEVKDIRVNGTSIGVPSGTYQVLGETTISATTAKLSYAVTWTDPANATISVTANGAAISNGAMVEAGTTLTITVEPTAIKYAVSSVKINGEDKGASGVYSYPVTSAVTIEAVVAEKSADVRESELWNEVLGNDGNNLSKYIDGADSWKIDDNGNLVSTSTNSTIKFTQEFLDLMGRYGFTTVSLTTTTTSSTYGTRVVYPVQGSYMTWDQAVEGAFTPDTSVTYTAQYKKYQRIDYYENDNNATWTIALS
jgi:hypothetical protein